MGLFRVLYCIGLYVFEQEHYSFNYCSFVMLTYFEVKCDTSSFVILLKIIWTTWSFSNSKVIILGFFFYFCKKCHWHFDRDCNDSIDSLVSALILAIQSSLNFPLQRCRFMFPVSVVSPFFMNALIIL